MCISCIGNYFLPGFNISWQDVEEVRGTRNFRVPSNPAYLLKYLVVPEKALRSLLAARPMLLWKALGACRVVLTQAVALRLPFVADIPQT